MKKIVLLLIISISTSLSYAQTTNYYEDLFLETTGITIDNSFVDYANRDQQLFFYYNISERMESLLLMYENTGNILYLDAFIRIANKVLNRRDDKRNDVPNDTGNLYDNIIAYDGLAHPTWSTRYYNKACPRYNGFDADDNGEIEEVEKGWHKDITAKNYTTCPKCEDIPHIIGNANIIYSFVRFHNIIKNGSILLQGTAYQHFGQSEDIAPLDNPTFKYIDVANALLAAAEETYIYYNSFWEQDPSDATKGYYREHLGVDPTLVLLEYKGSKLPMNKQASMGRVLVQLYKATNSLPYLDKTVKMANYIKSHTAIIDNAKQWTYWGYNDPMLNAVASGNSPDLDDASKLHNPLREDISHSALTAAFAYECFQNNIINTFTATDIEQYANTLLNDIYTDVLELDDGVHNGHVTNNTWNFKNNTNTHPLNSDGTPKVNAPGGYLYEYWMMYAETESKIYQVLTDFNTTSFYPPIGSSNKFSRNLMRPRTIAYLYAHQKLFAPIASEHGWGTSSNWSGVAGGNFDDDPLNGDEFVYLRNSNGAFKIGKITSTKGITNISSSVPYGANMAWGSIATGNFLGTDRDEIVAVSNQVGQSGYYIFDVEGILIDIADDSTSWEPDSNWVGAAAGDFKSGGKDDFVLARNRNLELLLYTFNTSGVKTAQPITSLITLLNLPLNATITGIASGNLINILPGDELVVLINSPDNLTNGYYIFSLNQITNTFTLVSQNTGWGTGHNWQALTVGDYDADGKDNIIIHGNLESSYKVYHVNETGISYSIGSLGLETFDARQVEGNILGSGNFDSTSANDELIVLRNTDAGIIIYTYTDRVVTPARPTNSDISPIEANTGSSIVEDEIVVYPNPTTGILTINVTNDISDIHINNLFGEYIKVSLKKNTIDVSSLSKGVYLLNIEFTNGKIITKKIIKN